MSVKLLLRVLGCVVAFALGLGSTVAFAAVGQDGRRTSSNAVDGTTSGVRGDSFTMRTNQCVLYSILMYNETSPHMVETGLVRCNAATIDGTCRTGHAFAERYNGAAFYCNEGNTFANGTTFNPIVSRDSGSSVSGAISGASIAQGGFPTGDAIKAYAWGEATGGASCPPGSTNGAFRGWQVLVGGWAVVGGQSVFHGGTLSGAPCFSVGGYSGGDFDVS